MDKNTIEKAFEKISKIMQKNRDYLIELDQRNGDGDLGISMSNGFRAVFEGMTESQEADLGRIFLEASKNFNEAATSS